MEALLLNASPAPPPELTTESRETPHAHPKLLELASEPGCRRVTRTVMLRLPVPPGKLSCPRCDSTNTKFCYYNNYNLSQPRHFCRACRRYWTRGGSLRNIPFGGGTRKTASSSNKRRRTTDTATGTEDDELVSSRCESGASGRAQIVDPDSGLGSLPKEAIPGTGSVECSWGNGQISLGGGCGGGLFPLNGHGVGQGFVYEQAFFDWPGEQVGGLDRGGVEVSGESPCCGTWQMGGSSDGGVVEGDYFTWADLAISTPAKDLK
ncbi:hypothetical protein OROGR_022318 [Orobanche gracilis]